MSDILSTPRYLIRDEEQPADCAQEVLNTYTMLLKSAAGERQAFEQAARIYQARKSGRLSNETARRAVAIIVCSRP
jgi:hypothetical protein